MPELLTGNNFPFVQDFSRQPHNSLHLLDAQALRECFRNTVRKTSGLCIHVGKTIRLAPACLLHSVDFILFLATLIGNNILDRPLDSFLRSSNPNAGAQTIQKQSCLLLPNNGMKLSTGTQRYSDIQHFFKSTPASRDPVAQNWAPGTTSQPTNSHESTLANGVAHSG